MPKAKVADVARMLKAIHAQEDRRSGEAKIGEVIAKLKAMRLTKAAGLDGARAHETLTYFAFPSNHWRQVKTNNPLEQIIREIRRHTCVVGAFPDGHSALMLVGARLRHIASAKWGKRRYLAMETLLNPLKRQLFESGSGYRQRKREKLLTHPQLLHQVYHGQRFKDGIAAKMKLEPTRATVLKRTHDLCQTSPGVSSAGGRRQIWRASHSASTAICPSVA